ncbi:MAG: hypothetical protein JNJ46_01605 [Myxococcales bacterium]|nr:hypothetical protein [Myxococcales bacterium]
MARCKRKLKDRSRAHVKHVRAARKKRIRAAGARRTAITRSARSQRRLAKKKG